jgi:hypothetical protein
MRAQRWIRAGVVLASVVVSGQLASCSSAASVAPKPDLSAPPPVLAKFVPVPDRVLSVKQMVLDPTLPPAVVVISVAPAVANVGMNYPVDTIRVLAWDTYAKRWTVVFDSATAQFSTVFPLDAVDDLYDVTVTAPPATSTPPPPPLAQLVDAQVAQVADQPHGGVDLAFEGVDAGTAVGAQLAGIVHFADGVATVGWAYEARDLGPFSVIGKAPNQQLAFEDAEWVTPADPECCGVRTFRFVVAKPAEPAEAAYYSVVSDNRSWLGAWVLSTYAANQVGAEVLAIAPKSPAAKTLKPGDVIESVVGTPARSGLLSRPVIDEIAAHTSGSVVTLNVDRGGKPMQVRVKLGSRDEQAAIVAPPPDTGYLGLSGETMTEQLAAEYSLPNVPGVLVTDAGSGTAAASAGLEADDIIVDIGSYLITSLGSLDLPLVQVGANSTTSLQFVTPQGVRRTVSVTLATPPQYGSALQDLAFV